jgi:hypothetical protein
MLGVVSSYAECRHAECCNDDFHYTESSIFIVMLSDVNSYAECH